MTQKWPFCPAGGHFEPKSVHVTLQILSTCPHPNLTHRHSFPTQNLYKTDFKSSYFQSINSIHWIDWMTSFNQCIDWMKVIDQWMNSLINEVYTSFSMKYIRYYSIKSNELHSINEFIEWSSLINQVCTSLFNEVHTLLINRH